MHAAETFLKQAYAMNATMHNKLVLSGTLNLTIQRENSFTPSLLRFELTGTAAFTFPTGQNGHYKPISITAPLANTTFKTRYANLNPSESHALTNKYNSLNEIGTNEFWILERTAGASNVSVTLSRNNMGCSNANVADLKITAFNGSTWKDLGQGSATGTDSSGTITSNGASTVYGMYTLATYDTFHCVPCRADAGEDLSTMLWQGVTIGKHSTIDDAFSWNPLLGLLNPQLEQTICIPAKSTQYTLIAANRINCIAKDAAFITLSQRTPVHTGINCTRTE